MGAQNFEGSEFYRGLGTLAGLVLTGLYREGKESVSIGIEFSEEECSAVILPEAPEDKRPRVRIYLPKDRRLLLQHIGFGR